MKYLKPPSLTSTCQATDASGCVPGDAKHIGSMEVDVGQLLAPGPTGLYSYEVSRFQDPNDTFQVAFKRNTNTLPFVCPSVGQIRCEANFNDNYDGPNYSLRGEFIQRLLTNIVSQLSSVF